MSHVKHRGVVAARPAHDPDPSSPPEAVPALRDDAAPTPDGRHPAVAAAVDQADRWLRAVCIEAGCDARDAYLALRATLHALRDRLPMPDAVRLGVRLPTLLRGVYFERFAADGEPRRIDTVADVTELVRQRLAPVRTRVDAADACAAVLTVLERFAALGELPANVRELLPRPVAAG